MSNEWFRYRSFFVTRNAISSLVLLRVVVLLSWFICLSILLFKSSIWFNVASTLLIIFVLSLLLWFVRTATFLPVFQLWISPLTLNITELFLQYNGSFLCLFFLSIFYLFSPSFFDAITVWFSGLKFFVYMKKWIKNNLK